MSFRHFAIGALALSLLASCRFGTQVGVGSKGIVRASLQADLRTAETAHEGYARLMRRCQTVWEDIKLSVDGSNSWRVGRVKQVASVGAALGGLAELVAGIQVESNNKTAAEWWGLGGAVVGFISAAIIAFVDSEDTTSATKQARLLRIDEARVAAGKHLAELHEKANVLGEAQYQSSLSLLFQNLALNCDVDLETFTTKRPPPAAISPSAAAPASGSKAIESSWK